MLGQRWGTRGDRTLRERLGIQLQETKLAEKLSVLETLTLFRSFYRRGPDPEEVIRRVALAELSAGHVTAMSTLYVPPARARQAG